jgi:hypothetical protein
LQDGKDHPIIHASQQHTQLPIDFILWIPPIIGYLFSPVIIGQDSELGRTVQKIFD